MFLNECVVNYENTDYEFTPCLKLTSMAKVQEISLHPISREFHLYGILMD
jgi:hypothetical protein